MSKEQELTEMRTGVVNKCLEVEGGIRDALGLTDPVKDSKLRADLQTALQSCYVIGYDHGQQVAFLTCADDVQKILDKHGMGDKQEEK